MSNGNPPVAFASAVTAVLGRAGESFGIFIYPYSSVGQYFALDLYGVSRNATGGAVSVTPAATAPMPPSMTKSAAASPAALSPITATPGQDPLNVGQTVVTKVARQDNGGNALVPPFPGFVGYTFVIPQPQDPIYIDSVSVYPVCDIAAFFCFAAFNFTVLPVDANGLVITTSPPVCTKAFGATISAGGSTYGWGLTMSDCQLNPLVSTRYAVAIQGVNIAIGYGFALVPGVDIEQCGIQEGTNVHRVESLGVLADTSLRLLDRTVRFEHRS
jgi:hypothetical protein